MPKSAECYAARWMICPAIRKPDVDLNGDQRAAVDAALTSLHAGRHETLLLHGVTGSGKTEVYIRTIQEVIRFGRQAIVLVPEISLTPQTLRRFRARFERVAVLHSHLSASERHWHWQRIARGEVQVIVGARSAVFALPRIWESSSWTKSMTAPSSKTAAPCYHAREVALRRARMEHIPLILGSATPSLESWQRATEGAYRLIDMPRPSAGSPAATRLDDRFTDGVSKPLPSWSHQSAAVSGDLRSHS